MHYTVVIVFDEGGQNVLLLQKQKTGFKGIYNGVGGKVEPHETSSECAYREFNEETGLDLKHRGIELHWVCTIQPCYNCEREEECFLHFFTGTIEEGLLDLNQDRTERLKWFPLKNVLHAGVENVPFNDEGDILAGNGDLPYVTNMAHVMLFGKIEDFYAKS